LQKANPEGNAGEKGTNQPPSGGTDEGASSATSPKTGSKAGKSNGKGKANPPQSAKASVFFEKLVCAVDDDRLIALTDEITRIQPANYPIASAMLLRALFESALTYQVKKAGKAKELNRKVGGKDIGLQALINFCANSQNDVFSHQRAASVLASLERAALKDHLDFIVHGRWVEAESAVVETAARLVRPLIKHIVEGNDLDLEDENA